MLASGSASMTGASPLAMPSNLASDKRGPTSVTPTGRLAGPRPAGMPTQGTCSSVLFELNDPVKSQAMQNPGRGAASGHKVAI